MYTVAVDLFVNCCGQQADSVTVFVTDNNTPYSGCGDMSISSNPTTLVFQCTPPKTGKYIVVEFVSHSSPPASNAAVSAFGTWIPCLVLCTGVLF